MTENKRSYLVQKMQKDVEDFFSNLKPKKYEDGWPEDKWEEEMEKHPMFMSKQLEEGQELPPLVEALQQLKYDPDVNSPEDIAKSYKDDGNHNFKCKKYHWAIESYTKGLEAKCENDDINAQLYNNRATAEYYLGNYNKALKDANAAKNLKANYIKALERGALCCFELHLFEECCSWCTEGLNIEPKSQTLIDLKNKAQECKKLLERNKRKAVCLEEKKRKENKTLQSAIKKRNINLVGSLDLNEIEPMYPALAGAKVHLNDQDALIWPVIFLYPEYGLTDYIQNFHEDACFMDHLNIMFNEENFPSWDVEHKYLATNLQVYFNNDDALIPVNKKQALKSILSDNRYKVYGGTPSFIITVKNSKFDNVFKIKNGLIN